MNAVLFLLTIATALPLQAGRAQSPPSTITLKQCLVSLINDAQVPAKEHGVLMELAAVEGQSVAAGDVLAKIDDLDVQAAFRVANFKHAQAKEEADSDITVRYAKSSADVAQADYQAAEEANKRVANTYPQGEMRKLWLVWKRGTLEIEKAESDHRIAALKAKVTEAEAEVAKENVQRRLIRAPLAGVVVELRRHVGEWVQPGDVVAHVVQLDRLRIEGFVNVHAVAPTTLRDRPVSVTVQLDNKRQESFTGKIVFVSPEVQPGGETRVWAEVLNRQQSGQWVLGPGLEAEMTVQIR